LTVLPSGSDDPIRRMVPAGPGAGVGVAVGGGVVGPCGPRPSPQLVSATRSATTAVRQGAELDIIHLREAPALSSLDVYEENPQIRFRRESATLRFLPLPGAAPLPSPPLRSSISARTRAASWAIDEGTAPASSRRRSGRGTGRAGREEASPTARPRSRPTPRERARPARGAPPQATQPGSGRRVSPARRRRATAARDAATVARGHAIAGASVAPSQLHDSIQGGMT